MANSRNSINLNKPTPRGTEQDFQRALEAILARVVLSEGGAIAVAYSGGLDSSVLLALAAPFCAARQLTLHAFHIHHGLSPQADDWLDHARARCEALQVRFEARKVSVDTTSEHGTEQAARLARYAALGDLCAERGVRLLLTAHHEDDQAETLMLQCLRGAGLPGLSGMAALQTQHALLPPGLALGRPLLGLSRAELAQFASAHHLPHVSDESNADVRYRRNALRQQIFPLIAEHFEGFTQTLSRTSRHLQAAQRLLNERAEEDLAQCGENGALLPERLAALSADRVDNLLRYWLQARTGQYPSEAQLMQIRLQMLGASDDAQPVVGTHGWVVERRRRRLIVRPAASLAEPPVQTISFHWQGETQIALPAWQGRLMFTTSAGPGLDATLLREGPLSLRPRGGGERLQLHPKRPSRTLKNLFQETDVPAAQRRWLPLLYAGERLVFAAGLGMDARAVTSEGGVVLRWEAGEPV